MTGCSHGMPTPASCLDCMNEGVLPAPKPQRPVTARVFTARYPGRCPACGDGFQPGDQIARTTNETYTHEECAR